MPWKRTPPVLVEAFDAALPCDPRLARRKMFGYPAAFVGSRMFAGTHEDRLFVRLPEAEREALLAHPGARRFEPTQKGVMREYVVVPPSLLRDRGALAEWLQKAFDYAAALPPKARRRGLRRETVPREGQAAMKRPAEQVRCGWVAKDALYMRYHDEEWGVPLHDERRLFEFLVLEGAQAGLSWITILRKRDAYREAFARFDPKRVAAFGAAEVRRLLADAGIVRNRLKIEAAIDNARAFLAVQKEHGGFDPFVWSFVGGAPLQNRWRSLAEVPAETEESRALSRELKKRGFRFVGPTICYAFMQAVGMVNDHVVPCFRHPELRGR